jgi:hypothetical protein
MRQTVNSQSPCPNSAILGQPVSTNTTYNAREVKVLCQTFAGVPSEELTFPDGCFVHIYRSPYAAFQSTNHVCRTTRGMMRLSH